MDGCDPDAVGYERDFAECDPDAVEYERDFAECDPDAVEYDPNGNCA
ncbi:hypothetical protein [Metabacillus sp. 84]